MIPDIARTLGEALGITKRDYLSFHCDQTAVGGAHHMACMGHYGGSVCRCWCHQEGTDARDVGLPG